MVTDKIRTEPGGAGPRRYVHSGEATSTIGLAAPLDAMLGDSELMRSSRALLRRIAVSPARTVLLTGETGTGKDLAAHAIHECSERRGRPFMNITCSALPETLLESELFGHERGAFTDAKNEKRGLLELADGGTVFLDEIGELSAGLQSKLLRFLEERAFRRVGGAADIHVDVRVIAATNRDLRAEVDAGRFRVDLFFRLSVLAIQLPRLQDRREDLPMLVEHFVALLNREYARTVVGLTAAALERVRSHAWPGNVRELRNVVERAVLLSDGDLLELDGFVSLPLGVADPERHAFDLPETGVNLEHLERGLLLQALARTKWNRTSAGRLLGLNRDQVRYRIEKFQLER